MTDEDKKNQWLPRRWYLFLFLLLLVGIALLSWQPVLAAAFGKISSRVKADDWPKLLGILFVSVPLTSLAISLVLRFTGNVFDLKGPILRVNLWPPAFMGVLEAVLYPMALLARRPEFIGLWLALKVAGQWPRWGNAPIGEGDNREENLNERRRRYSSALIGNALSLIAALITYAFLKMFVLDR